MLELRHDGGGLKSLGSSQNTGVLAPYIGDFFRPNLKKKQKPHHWISAFFMQGCLRGWRLEALSSAAALNYLMKNCIILPQQFHSVWTPASTLCTVHTLLVLVSFPNNINVCNVRHAWISELCSKGKKQLKLWLNKGNSNQSLECADTGTSVKAMKETTWNIHD